ncbi:hypothetical protein [Sinorhizobium fredii]|uniref:hypothetical protein n=1 Tax=Rhizobium fredii TaxID=380 RepID=UPI0005956606|nr:hypothetical protein [Sinorhizobium fredii]WOS62991.1 hypothetical protein SFGR64A_00900 [Sinorhizobium fredii GR64]
MSRKRKLRPIIWKKPLIEGVPLPFPRSPLEGLSKRESKRYWMLFLALVVGTVPALICLKAIDGHWWVGNIGGFSALCLTAALVLPFFAGFLELRKLVRRGAAVVAPFNERETVYGLPPSSERISESSWKLLCVIAFLILVAFGLWDGVERLLDGLPPREWPVSAYRRRRYRLAHYIDQLLAPYVPHGPLFPMLLMVGLVLLILLFLREIWRRLKREFDV